MISVSTFLAGAGEYYAKKPAKSLSSIETLAWGAAEDLASFIENAIDPADLQAIAPSAYLTLWGLEAYFKDIGHLPSQAHGLLMLHIERANWGLTRLGDDTVRLKTV